MSWTVLENIGTHPAYPVWELVHEAETAKAAHAWAEAQMTAVDEIDGTLRTTFGINGVRILNPQGQEVLWPDDDAVTYGGAAPFAPAAPWL